MKRTKLLSGLVIASLLFVSCSNNDNLLEEEKSQNSLEKYTIKRDASGAYSLDFNVSEGVAVEKVIDAETNTNTFYLDSFEEESNKTSFSQDLSIEGESLKVDFLSSDNENAPSFTIFDDTSDVLNKSSNEKLEDYSITSNGDGTYVLDFTVKNNVKAEFIYNEKTNVYEIHLQEGKSTTKKYKRILIKEEKRFLKFAFINNDLSIFNKSSEERGKPKGEIGDAGDGF